MSHETPRTRPLSRGASRSKKPAKHTHPDPVSGNRGRHLQTPPTQPDGSAAGAGQRVPRRTSSADRRPHTGPRQRTRERVHSLTPPPLNKLFEQEYLYRSVFAFPTGARAIGRVGARRFDAAGVSNAAPTGTVARKRQRIARRCGKASEQNRGRRRWRHCLHAPRPAI